MICRNHEGTALFSRKTVAGKGRVDGCKFSPSGRTCKRRSASAFCLSLRASAHTGVAIRVPAEEGRNQQRLGQIRHRYGFASSAAFCFVLPPGERIAASRGGRPAPRNDRLKHAGWPQLQGRGLQSHRKTCCVSVGAST